MGSSGVALCWEYSWDKFMLNMPEQPAPRNFLWTRKKVAI